LLETAHRLTAHQRDGNIDATVTPGHSAASTTSAAPPRIAVLLVLRDPDETARIVALEHQRVCGVPRKRGAVMYAQLKSRLAALLRRPRPLKPQTERQLASQVADRSSSTESFLLGASALLEDHELDILFGPLFTPTVDDRAEVADLLFHWRPTPEQVGQLVAELSAEVQSTPVMLPDGRAAQLTLHEVMIDRFVRLLRLDSAPDPATSAAMREVLPPELWSLAVALLCERGMTPEHQKWFAGFVNHVAAHRVVSGPVLQTAADFIAGQRALDRASLLAAAEALMRATQVTASYADGGHAYWSPDVAQHHQYRGQGRVDRAQLEERHAEVERVAALVEDLKTFEH
jgi:hypothetical protein